MDFTFAVIGRNEAPWLPVSLGQALEAAHEGDEVVFVDSGSTDGSRAVAESLGVPAIAAPAGKGNAVAAALAASHAEHVVLVDADIDRSQQNIPGVLRAAVAQTGADLVVGDFDWPERPRLRTDYVYKPLVAALFPEALDAVGPVPFSGFRALRRDFPWGALPGGYGVEAHVNLAAVTAGASIAIADLGRYYGPVRSNRALGEEVGAAILDAAVRHGRITADARPRWHEWLDPVLAAIASGEGEAAIKATAASPLPPRRVHSAAT